MAALLGVNVDRTISLTFVIGAALAAVAGMMFLLYYGVIDFYIGFNAGIKAFTAAVLGGIGSLPGAMLGGLLIGLIETFWSAYFSVEYKDVAAFSILAIVADLPAVRPARPARSGEGLRAWRRPRTADGRLSGRRRIADEIESPPAIAVALFGLLLGCARSTRSTGADAFAAAAAGGLLAHRRSRIVVQSAAVLLNLFVWHRRPSAHLVVRQARSPRERFDRRDLDPARAAPPVARRWSRHRRPSSSSAALPVARLLGLCSSAWRRSASVVAGASIGPSSRNLPYAPHLRRSAASSSPCCFASASYRSIIRRSISASQPATCSTWRS